MLQKPIHSLDLRTLSIALSTSASGEGQNRHTCVFWMVLFCRHPFDEQYLTMTAMAAARAPIKRKVSVATYDIYKYASIKST